MSDLPPEELEKIEKDFRKYIRFGLRNCWCWEKGQLYWILNVSAASLYMLFSVYTVLRDASTMNDVLEALIQFFYMSVTFCVVAAWVRKEKIRDLVDHALNVYTYEDDELQDICERKRNVASLKAFYVRIFINNNIAFITIGALSVLDSFLKSGETENYEELFLLRIYTPLAVTTIPRYLVVYIFHQFIILSITLSGLAGMCLCMYQNQACHNETEALIAVMDQLDGIVEKRTAHLKQNVVEQSAENENQLQLQESNLEKARNQLYHKLIVQIYNHNQAIYHYTCAVVESYTMSSVFVISVNFMLMVMFMCNSMMNTKNVAHMLTWGFAIIPILLFIYLISYSGEYYIAVTNRFNENLYFATWYDKSLYVQKMFLVMLQVTTFEVRLQVAPRMYLSYAFFAGVIQKAYTLFNFLVYVLDFS